MASRWIADEAVNLSKLPSFRAEHFPYSGPYPWLDQPDAEEAIEARHSTGEITAEQAEQCSYWSKNGYIVIPKLFDDETLDIVWEGYEQAVGKGKIKLEPEAAAAPAGSRPFRFPRTGGRPRRRGCAHHTAAMTHSCSPLQPPVCAGPALPEGRIVFLRRQDSEATTSARLVLAADGLGSGLLAAEETTAIASESSSRVGAGVVAELHAQLPKLHAILVLVGE